jgi:mono/diheme cytochrome c family protein
MPPLIGGFDPVEERALVAYVRHLSEGYAIYDFYCAMCHGDDGRGVHAEDLLAPTEAAPPLARARLVRLGERERRAKLAHMLRREEGSMPHFRGILDDDRLRDIIVYLRTWER